MDWLMSNSVKVGGGVPYSEIGISKYSFGWFEPGGRWKVAWIIHNG